MGTYRADVLLSLSPSPAHAIWMQIAGELIPETDNYPGLSLVNNVSFEECIFVRETGGYFSR